MTPGLSTPTVASGYHPPILTGRTVPGATVIVEFDGQLYGPSVDAAGQWSFDLRPFNPQSPDPDQQQDPKLWYDYRVWAYTEDQQSPAVSGTFTLLAVEVRGLLPDIGEQMLIDEARSTGVVVEVTGPASGTVCLALPFSDEYAVIDLGESGTTRIRLRFFENGFYALNFRVCSDEYFTVSTERFVAVEDPTVLWEPWAPDPTLDAIEIEVLADP